uniref:Uncharacterized protein n=1 Tax=Siphoviridae sp. ctkyp1 TaxID=2825646 RepID=A0A8S5P3U8_9CAUD|nr:MAG TPA: hypothetical protein [Siphoviridae sp. ctkyp1]
MSAQLYTVIITLLRSAVNPCYQFVFDVLR